jgi:tRNA-Thr(GGU) m(6)t(6)A37 methyltransferase TsaA
MQAAAVPFHPIGVIRSRHTSAEHTPIQPAFAKGCEGRAEILPEFAAGLDGLDGFSHIYLIFHLHRAGSPQLRVKPFLQDVERGVFATRAPCRPNAIGLSVVELVRREGNVLYLDGVDILDGTPLLDIKPYTARFDRIDGTRNGWQDEVDEATARTRGRRGFTTPRPTDQSEKTNGRRDPMPEFASPFSGMAHDRKLTKEELVRAIRFMVAAEYEAVQMYLQLAESTDDTLAVDVLTDIADEERVHAGEFLRLLYELAPDERKFYDEGSKEVEEEIKKRK